MALCGLCTRPVEEILVSDGAASSRVKFYHQIDMHQHTSGGEKTSKKRWEKVGNRMRKFFGINRRGTADDPLIPQNSGNVFHDQALMQLASVYESLQLGDSHEAVIQVYDLGERIFGRELFDKAVRDGQLTGVTA